jgi:peptidase M28-like protein/PDZ domain-containing protein/PA domain-containing protein
MARSLVALAASFALAFASSAQASEAQITAPEIKDHVAYLASDALEGRGTATKGERAAAAYISKQWASYGLQPGGEDGTWFQSFNVASRGSVESGRLTIEAGGWERSFKLNQDFAPFGFSSNASKLDVELVFAGFGITNPEANYDDYAGIDVKGKAVVVLRREPNARGRSSRHAYFSTKAENAKKHGAAALIVINDADHPQGDGILPFSAGDDVGIPAVHLRRDHLQKLMALMGRDLGAIEDSLENKGPASFTLGRAALGLGIKRGAEVARNVLGFLPGSDPKLKNEVIVIGAHYDHLGAGHHGGSLGGRDARGEIHNGADDNASGTAGIIELAQAFAQRPPKRSLLFIGFSGEERGLLGSAHWVKSPTLPIERVAGMVNLDMIGRLREGRLEVGGVGTAKSFTEMVKKEVEAEGLVPKLSASGFGPSDHASFCKAGIPVLFFFTGLHADYHRPTDVVDRLNADGAAKVARIAQRCIQQIADGERQAFVTLKRNARVRRARIGIYPSRTNEGPGVAIERLAPGGPAEKQGLKAGDVILKVGKVQLNSLQDLFEGLATLEPGSKVKLTYRRGEKTTTIDFKLGE